MKNKLIISISIFALITIILTSFNSCKREKKLQEYTIKGTCYSGKIKTPIKKRHFVVRLYTKKMFRNSPISEDLGDFYTDENGYFEFTYKELKSGNWIHIEGPVSYDEKYTLLPINTNVNMEFYNPPCGTVDLYLNTNNKLSEDDTFFIQYITCTPAKTNNGLSFDTIYGNHSGFIRRINLQRGSARFGSKYDFIGGARIKAGKGYNGLFRYGPGNVSAEIDSIFPLKGNPDIDEIYIEY